MTKDPSGMPVARAALLCCNTRSLHSVLIFAVLCDVPHPLDLRSKGSARRWAAGKNHDRRRHMRARRLIVALLDGLQEAHLQATGREHWNLRARVETDCGSDRRTLVFCVTGDHERSSRSNTCYETAGVVGAQIRPWARVDSGHRSCAAGGM